MELTQPLRTGDFILSLANGTRSLENAILAIGNVCEAGTVLGLVTASGEYAPFNPAGADGTEVAAGILRARTDATAAATAIVVVARDSEVKIDALVWPAGITEPQRTAAIAELNDLGIYVR